MRRTSSSTNAVVTSSLVHRDVSPQNILVGVDGLARVADFGVAKFSRKTDSSEGSLKGKLAYMAPEYLRGEAIDRRFDIFALGIVLWETLAGKRLFRAKSEAETLRMLLEHEPESLAAVAPAAAALDGILKTALARPVTERFQNAQAMAAALETTAIAAGLCGGHTEVAAALKDLVGDAIEQRRALVRASLAHEPSLASLMGNAAPPAVTDAAIANATIPSATIVNATIVNSAVPSTVAAVPSTVAEVPPTVVDEPHEPHKPQTPRLGGAFDQAPNARTEPLGGALNANAALAAAPGPQTSVPSTLPMTPRMAGAPERTLASPAATPMKLPVAASSGATLASAAPMADPSAPRVDATGDTQLSFNDPSARSAYDPIPKPPSNKALPIALGLVAIVIAGVAIVFAASRTTRSAAVPPREAPVAAESAAAMPAPSSSASAAPAATTATASLATASASATTTSAVAAQPSARRPAKPAPPAGTSKKPPPNPYATE